MNALANGCRESNPMNTLFGDRNGAGVALSMTAWELGFSYASGKVPRLLGHGRTGTIARFAFIAGGSLLTRGRIQVSFNNQRNTR